MKKSYAAYDYNNIRMNSVFLVLTTVNILSPTAVIFAGCYELIRECYKNHKELLLSCWASKEYFSGRGH